MMRHLFTILNWGGLVGIFLACQLFGLGLGVQLMAQAFYIVGLCGGYAAGLEES